MDDICAVSNSGRTWCVRLSVKLLSTSFAWLLAAGAWSQTGRLFPTVDAMVASASGVHVGVLQSAELTPLTQAPWRNRCVAVFNVGSTMKGKSRSKLTIDFTTSLPAAFLETLASKHPSFLLLSYPRENEVASNLAHKMGSQDALPTVWFRLFEADTERYQDWDHNVFTSDLRVISSFADLVKESQRAVKAYPGHEYKLTYFTPPNSVSRMCGDPNAYAAVTVPVAPQTEAIAKRMIQRPSQVVSGAARKSRKLYRKPTLTAGDLTALRLTGMRVLGEFPTEANRAVMRKMLSVPELEKEAQYNLERMTGG